MPKRIQRKRSKGWRMPPNTVYVGRPGPWGNPFVVGKHGDAAECVRKYNTLLCGFLTVGIGNIEEQKECLNHIDKHLGELRGKDLACWCRVGRPCHADTLLAIANKEERG